MFSNKLMICTLNFKSTFDDISLFGYSITLKTNYFAPAFYLFKL